MIQILRTAALLLGLLTLLTGLVYPLLVTVVAQTVFPKQANGSLLKYPDAKQQLVSKESLRSVKDVADPSQMWIGSELIGQAFTDPKYFWSRPSATAPVAYNGLGGSGSNLAATNPALVESVRERVAKLRAADPDNQTLVPIDLVTASSSGLDPHISEAGALYQVNRVARARNTDPSAVSKMVLGLVERPTIGIFGQSRVNVLKLNLVLDEAFAASSSQEADPSR